MASKVHRRDISVYALSSEAVGRFDFAFIGTLLLHLRDPVRALTAIRDVLGPGGRLLVNDAVALGISLRHPRTPVYTLTLLPGKPFWWLPNVKGLHRYVEKAGFESRARRRPVFPAPRSRVPASTAPAQASKRDRTRNRTTRHGPRLGLGTAQQLNREQSGAAGAGRDARAMR